MLRLQFRGIALAAGAFATLVGVAIVSEGRQTSPRGSGLPAHKISIAGSYGGYDTADLAIHADAVAVVRPVGLPNIHWNNRANEPWAVDDMGRVSHILRDQRVVIDQVLAGTLADKDIIVRGVGGRLGHFEVVYEDAPTFDEGARYLAFLHQESTPTREGPEFMWTTVWLGHGVFRQDRSGVWLNVIGKVLDARYADEIVAP